MSDKGFQRVVDALVERAKWDALEHRAVTGLWPWEDPKAYEVKWEPIELPIDDGPAMTEEGWKALAARTLREVNWAMERDFWLQPGARPSSPETPARTARKRQRAARRTQRRNRK